MFSVGIGDQLIQMSSHLRVLDRCRMLAVKKTKIGVMLKSK